MHITSSYNNSYSKLIQAGYERSSNIQQGPSHQVSVGAKPQEGSVSISAEARMLSVSQMGSAGLNIVTKLGPEFFAESARRRIGQLLEEMDIPKNTPVTVTANAKGNIEFKTDHPDQEKIEAALAEDTPLREAILAGQFTAGIELIEMAKTLARENLASSDNDALNQAQVWLQEITRDIRKMPYVTHYNGDSVSASFEDGKGNLADYINNLETPKFS